MTTSHTSRWGIGAILLAVLLAVGVTALCRKPHAVVALLPKSWFSKEDIRALKDPDAANKEAYEKMSREAWERARTQQPPNGWQEGGRR